MSVAIYVPGSTASYPSSVLMNAIPAIVAGVKRIVMINPGFKGKQNPAVLYAARKCKIKENLFYRWSLFSDCSCSLWNEED